MTAVAFEETQALAEAPSDEARDLVVAVTPPGDTSSFVTVEQYYVELGDQVRRGAAVCLVRSECYVFDLPARTAGVVEELLVESGAMVKLGQPLLRIVPAVSSVTEAIQPPSPPPSVTPLARQIASVHNLELGTIHGTGPGGRIRAADVRAVISDNTEAVLGEGLPDVAPAVSSLLSTPLAVPRSIALTGPRPFAQNGEQVSIIHDERPFALTAIEVALPVIGPVTQSNGQTTQHGLEITGATVIAHAAVTALIEHPWLNSAWTDEGVIIYGRVDLGILAHVNGSAQLTVIERAADLSLQGLERAILTAPPATIQQPTFTVIPGASAWWFEPVSVTGSGVVLSIGYPTRRPVGVETPTGSTVVIRDRALLTLAYDARYIAQSEADAFLCAIQMRFAGENVRRATA